jgi:small subunit ribosomal protein S19
MNNRSVWKGPFISKKLLHKIKRISYDKKHIPIRTWSRSSTILPNFIGLTFSLYNGKKFAQIFITESMIGKKMGEFVKTRKFTGHIKNENKK